MMCSSNPKASVFIYCFCFCGLFANGTAPAAKIAAPKTNETDLISFEKNKGQWPDRVEYKTDVKGGRRIFLERDRFTYVLYDQAMVDAVHESGHQTKPMSDNTRINFHAFQMKFVGSSAREIQENNQREFFHNYFIGNDPSHWASNVPLFQSLIYKELYSGIDLLVHSDGLAFKYDYLVAPGARVSDILIAFEGADRIQLVDGKLSILTSVGEILESIPACYQEVNGKRTNVRCQYKLNSDNQVSFYFPDGFDVTKPLVIDPVVVASTYSGSQATTYGHCATYDNSGNIYTGGRCFATGYPVTTGAFQLNFGGSVDIAISKLNPTGSALIYATYIGGSASDFPHSLFVDANNNLFVYGSSVSNNYPSTSNAFDPTANGLSEIVISKLNSTGSTLMGSTFLGGTSDDGLNNGVSLNYGDNYRGEIVVDLAGDVFIAGTSSSANFPVTTGAYNTVINGQQDVVVAKLNNALTSVLWATFLGGTAHDAGCSLRVNSIGEVCVVGLTKGGSFPTTNGAITSTFQGGTADGFVAKLNSGGTSLIASTLLGTAQMDGVYFVDLDYADDIYVYGASAGSMPISSGVYSNANSQNFVCKLNTSLTSIIYSTVLGNGSHATFSPCAFMVDYCQNIYLCGWGSNSNYPVTTNANQGSSSGNCFSLMVLSQNAASLIYGSFFGAGGEHVDGGTSRFDKSGKVYQGVCCCGANFPTLSNAYSPTKVSGGCDIVVFKIDFDVNCNALSTSTVICFGSAANFTIQNVNGLLSPTFVVQPGNLTNNTGIYSFTPQTNSIYSVTMQGYTPSNALITNTGVISITVNPMPSLNPTVIPATCTSPTLSFNLGLSFLPTSATPTYVILWSSLPTGITSNTQLASSGTLVPGVYNVTLTSAGGCKAFTSLTLDPTPEPAQFNIGGPFQISCEFPVRTISLSPSAYSYTWTGITGMYNGPVASFSAPNIGTWTVVGLNNNTGCFSTQTFVLTQNNAPSSSTIFPVQQNINCQLTSITSVTAQGNPTVNVTHYWMTPSGGTLSASTATASFLPVGPGTYTHVLVNLSNGCSVTKTFTVTSNSGFPTFNVVSPQNFTLGCNTKSIITINNVFAQTTPPGGSVNYTLLPPGFSGTYAVGATSSFTNVTLPGNYTLVTKDMVTGCETQVPVTVLQNTFSPDLSVNVKRDVLTCDYPSVLLQAGSTTPNVGYLWSFPGLPGNAPGDSLRVNITSNASSSLVANFTLVITDNNNTCRSTAVVPILQNIIRPKAIFSGAAPITCKTATMTLTNMSTTNVLPFFNPILPVVGYQWQGPTPMEPEQLKTTYVAGIPGVYTLTAKDLNNGCISTYTAFVDDGRDFPSLRQPEAAFTLDCGAQAVSIYPTMLGPTKDLAYDWKPVPDVAFSALNTPTTLVNKTGHYEIVITNTVNGCVSSGLFEVEQGTLNARFTAEPETGFAPLSVQFTNLSASSTTFANTAPIISIWSFGNGKSATFSISAHPSTIYTQPGKFNVHLFVSKGTCLDTISHQIEVMIPSKLDIPNIFTPNGDGNNDLFFVHAANLTTIKCKIIDRWGHEVYSIESHSGNIEWDGTNQTGKVVAEGVYFYVLKASGADGVSYDHTGSITLVR